MNKGKIVLGEPNRYFDKNGAEIFEGDFIVLNAPDYYYHNKPLQVYKWKDEYGNEGLGIDATNPIWIERGRAVPCEFGIYPLTNEDLEEAELVGER